MLEVAEHINQAKKRSDLVGRIVNKGDAPRRDPNVSASAAFGRSMTKKLLRSSQKVKLTVGVGQQERDDMFDTLSALVDSTRSSVLRFSNEAQDWSRNTRVALESQAAMVEGWIELYAPMEGEGRTLGGGHERLCAFLDNVLGPVLDGPYQDLVSSLIYLPFYNPLTQISPARLIPRTTRCFARFWSKPTTSCPFSRTLVPSSPNVTTNSLITLATG